MKSIKIPRLLYEVLGEKQDALGIALIALVGCAGAASYAVLSSTGTASPIARIVAVVLAADLGAGAAANFTRGTSDYYARRPGLRWAFIAIHLHLPLMALLAGADIWPSIALWAFTIAAASIVNLAPKRRQAAIAGPLLALGLLAHGAIAWVSPAQRLAAVVFLVKVAYAFAVDHYAAEKVDPAGGDK